MKDVLIYVSINFERLPCNCKHLGPVHINFKKGANSNLKRVFSLWYHVRGKITECRSADTERILLNLEGTFGNQEGMIT